MVKLAQLGSLVSKRFSSAEGLRRSPEELVEITAQLDEELERVRQSLQDDFGCHFPFRLSRPSNSLTAYHALNIQFKYYSVLWDIHISMVYPWVRRVLDKRSSPAFAAQIEYSRRKMAEASRSAILDTQFIPVGANCPFL